GVPAVPGVAVLGGDQVVVAAAGPEAAVGMVDLVEVPQREGGRQLADLAEGGVELDDDAPLLGGLEGVGPVGPLAGGDEDAVVGVGDAVVDAPAAVDLE